jgi:hypothetical protein
MRLGASRDLLENLMIRNEQPRRCSPLFSIERQFAKVEVAGSNPVSRSFLPTTWLLHFAALLSLLKIS